MKPNDKFTNTLYKISIKNALIVILFSSSIAFLLISVINFYSLFIDIELILPTKSDLITIYVGILGLLLPLIILLIEIVSNKKDYIESTVYLKETMMFPILVHLCTELIIFIFTDNLFYYAIACVAAVIFMIYMYLKSFKLLSDFRYESLKINEVRKEVVKEDIDSQVKQFTRVDDISKYKKYGIFLHSQIFINSNLFKNKQIKPKKDLDIIDGYNTQALDRISKKLDFINEKYIEDYNEKELSSKIWNKANILIVVSSVGTTLKRSESCIYLYYKENIDIKDISELLTDEIYLTSDNNIHYYLESNYDNLLKDCMTAISMNSTTLLSNSLDRIETIYKDYIDYFKEVAGDYNYKEAYDHTHTIEQIRIYDLFKKMEEIIYDCAQATKQANNSNLANKVIGFLYSLIFYSYTKEELLSIQHLDQLYCFLNNFYLGINDYESIYKKIKLEMFEFTKIIKYDLSRKNIDFCKNALLVKNKTIGNLINNLSKRDYSKFKQYLNETFEFIEDIKEEKYKLEYANNTSKKEEYEAYKEILENYECNVFVILAYIVQRDLKKSENIDDILKHYESYNVEELTDIYLKINEKDYNDPTYAWSFLDENHESGEVYTVKTINYVTKLYCIILNKKKSINEFPLSYELSTHSNDLIENFEQLNNNNLVISVKNLSFAVEEERKRQLRCMHINPNKVNKFKKDFLKAYKENSDIYRLYSKTNNLSIIDNSDIKTGDKNFLKVDVIHDKTYFLDELPFNENIYWIDFEESFANSFINGEENKFAKIIQKKAKESKIKFIDYLSDIDNKKELVVFSNFNSIQNLVPRSFISYTTPPSRKFNGIKASRYIEIDNVFIPIIRLDDLKEGAVYVSNINELGNLLKSSEEFVININEFNSNSKLLEKAVKSNIEGINLKGDDKRNHLLEKVEIEIYEYAKFDTKNLKVTKFTF